MRKVLIVVLVLCSVVGFLGVVLLIKTLVLKVVPMKMLLMWKTTKLNAQGILL